jgi:hypothetical protein
VNPIEGLVAKCGASGRLRRLIGLGISALSALMIASFVAKNAGVTKADITRFGSHIGKFSVTGLLAERPYYLHRIFEPNAGEAEALPAVVSQGISLARAHRLREVNISPGFWADDQLRIRFGEGLYPIRLDRDRTSTLVIFGIEDQPVPACELVGQRPLVRLIKCQ